MQLLIYNFSIRLYSFVAFFLSFFNSKAKLWIDGRKNTFSILSKINMSGCIWIHTSSLGEFEQARPIIEKIKLDHPEQKIAVSFFSPSGYEIRKNYDLADVVFYLPEDTSNNAKRLLNILQPTQIIWVKYDFWYHHLKTAHNLSIPITLICSTFRSNQIFFKWYGSLFREILTTFKTIFVQNQTSKDLLNNIHIESKIANDSRFDRVYKIATSVQPNDFIQHFKSQSQLIIFGSTWDKDEKIIIEIIPDLIALFPTIKFIIAPHQIVSDKISSLQNSLKISSVLYSKKEDYTNESICIIDNIGLLSQLYAYAHITYVGGGFGVSVHNVLEPAVFGIPVIFAPHYTKSVEAIELVDQSSGFVISNAKDLKDIIIKLLNDKTQYEASAALNKNYVMNRIGGTNQIMSTLYEK